MNLYYPYGKRLFDLCVILLALPLFIILLPFLLLLAITIRLETHGPVFFSHMRAGYKGEPFRIYKFRTLIVNNVHPSKLPDGADHPMATRVGRILRRSKLDELPQLWNVLKGEMSLVGPRPAFPEMTLDFNSEQKGRMDVPPGLTGWAQVNGNTELSWDERIRLDLWYVDHVSFLLDLRILFMTVAVVFFDEQIKQTALKEADRYLATLQEQSRSTLNMKDWDVVI